MPAHPKLLRRRAAALLVSSMFVLAACQTTPTAKAPAAAGPAAVPPPVATTAPVSVAPGILLSPPRQGDSLEGFDADTALTRTFPINQIGANLAFTNNLRMPKLEAVVVDADTFQLRMRFVSATTTPLRLSVDCVYAEQTRPVRSLQNVDLPPGTFRDLVMTLDGQPSRKVNIRATATPAGDRVVSLR